ncbi:recombinase family protein [Litoreibacter meonggei]|uniref:recombinase family protein n=1 Tax=Litoreibacter meonggei TaxID=1049199 RepID=UPI003CCC6A66
MSSKGQSLDRQIGALNTAKADKIFREVASGRTVKGRPQLERAIDALGAGDILVIAEWDRARASWPFFQLWLKTSESGSPDALMKAAKSLSPTVLSLDESQNLQTISANLPVIAWRTEKPAARLHWIWVWLTPPFQDYDDGSWRGATDTNSGERSLVFMSAATNYPKN